MFSKIKHWFGQRTNHEQVAIVAAISVVLVIGLFYVALTLGVAVAKLFL
ncbi:hypothetical protein [uncultured Ferrimonas sp.]|nr:hypothetical protein [uncultured Ferrimonas sp.]